MKKIFKLACFLLFLTSIVSSCILKTEPIYITTFTMTSNGDKKNDKVVKETTILNTDYFEVSFELISNKAYKNIEKSSSEDLPNFKLMTIGVTDEKGNWLNFKTSTDFLDFMSKHGYKMVDQKKSEYSTDYTFKKK